ncbi:hypothetical protein FGK63_20370 [Ruegeria sediminis]|uniref:Formate dehydrogenase accessory protein FdhE n=1 Tax=Ruegeria sediminis TaxID=2583820 RepID=A0ABY2WSR8_9RHOB|nr:hypothetical protein [Ruegeria sediminis]TMV02585.1 hypothetical protein FGK63_20370 [Ruegeria sediminis]
MRRNLIDWTDIEASVKRHMESRPGWIPLVIEVLETIKEHADFTGDQPPNIVEIKQKLGGLRIYTDPSPDHVLSVLERAEIKAESTCEICGNAARVQDFYGYLACRCSWCAHDLIDERRGVHSPEPYILNQRLPEVDRDLCCTECGYFGQRVQAWNETRCPVCIMNDWLLKMASNLVSIQSQILQKAEDPAAEAVKYTVVYGHDFTFRHEVFKVTGHMRADDLLERCAHEVRVAIEGDSDD